MTALLAGLMLKLGSNVLSGFLSFVLKPSALPRAVHLALILASAAGAGYEGYRAGHAPYAALEEKVALADAKAATVQHSYDALKATAKQREIAAQAKISALTAAKLKGMKHVKPAPACVSLGADVVGVLHSAIQ